MGEKQIKVIATSRISYIGSAFNSDSFTNYWLMYSFRELKYCILVKFLYLLRPPISLTREFFSFFLLYLYEKMDVSCTYYNHFTIYIMLYALNLPSDICQLFSITLGKKSGQVHSGRNVNIFGNGEFSQVGSCRNSETSWSKKVTSGNYI